ncbi:hypothetical protein TRIP_B330205 [uncultured Desulfatiglans sp.]|nr:hypothetical protein TRIP_B330205 [uncultured Desulfatiglans sp.]
MDKKPVKQKKDSSKLLKSLFFLARLGGLGPPTCGLEVRCSIQLSYRRLDNTT